MQSFDKDKFILVDGVLYKKDIKFGNRKRVKIHKNKKKYGKEKYKSFEIFETE